MGYKKELIKGISWMSGFRGLTRIIAILKIAILARFLTPSQFGSFAIASLVLTLLETITETGINVFLIQEHQKYKKFIDTAWIISIIRGIFIFFIIFILASPISIFFNSQDSYLLIILISFVPLIRGFINPMIVSYQIDLSFNKEFYFRSFLFLIDTIFAIIFSILLASPLGIVFGFLISAVAETLLSFLLFKEKPKFKINYQQAKQIIKVGKWLTAGGVFKYLAEQADDIIIGKYLNIYFLGLYQNAYKISTLPIYEITGVSSKVSIPIFAKIHDDYNRFKVAFIKYFISVSIVSISLGVFIFIFSYEIIIIFLGENWLESYQALRILAIYGIIASIVNITNTVFVALKRQDIFAKIRILEFIIIIITIYPLINLFGISGAAVSTVISSLISLPVSLYMVMKVIKDINLIKNN